MAQVCTNGSLFSFLADTLKGYVLMDVMYSAAPGQLQVYEAAERETGCWDRHAGAVLLLYSTCTWSPSPEHGPY